MLNSLQIANFRLLEHALRDDLFDAACPPFAGFSAWLRRIFP